MSRRLFLYLIMNVVLFANKSLSIEPKEKIVLFNRWIIEATDAENLSKY